MQKCWAIYCMPGQSGWNSRNCLAMPAVAGNMAACSCHLSSIWHSCGCVLIKFSAQQWPPITSLTLIVCLSMLRQWCALVSCAIWLRWPWPVDPWRQWLSVHTHLFIAESNSCHCLNSPASQITDVAIVCYPHWRGRANRLSSQFVE